MKRKSFILQSATLAAMYPLINALHACNVKQKGAGKKVFVFIQLAGGNDGLHTLIPLDNYKKIHEARKNIFIPENKILSLKGTSDCGLHPSMGGIKNMFDNGLAGFVQGVGYEQPNFSHFRSSDIWLTGAESSKVLYTGWMARYLETKFKNYPDGYPNTSLPDPPAIKIGDTGTFLFQGQAMDMSLVINPNIPFGESGTDAAANEDITFGMEEVKTIREMLLQSDRYAGTVKKALHTPFASSKLYPKKGENPLADQLKVVAQLINAGLETSVYLVDLKGFDTHVEQATSSDSTKGVHADLLHKVSQAISCFWDDVVHLGRENDVAGMTFSEFGRRIVSTSGYGTDHGSSQPILFFGANIKSPLIGHNPIIPKKITVEDNLDLQYDFKSVYASILKQWFNAPDNVSQSVLGGEFDALKMFYA
jgi:uncharacterized protein (DUF1501 family)